MKHTAETEPAIDWDKAPRDAYAWAFNGDTAVWLLEKSYVDVTTLDDARKGVRRGMKLHTNAPAPAPLFGYAGARKMVCRPEYR